MGSVSSSVRSISSFSRNSTVARSHFEEAESFISRNNSLSSQQVFKVMGQKGFPFCINNSFFSELSAYKKHKENLKS